MAHTLVSAVEMIHIQSLQIVRTTKQEYPQIVKMQKSSLTRVRVVDIVMIQKVKVQSVTTGVSGHIMKTAHTQKFVATIPHM